MATGRFVEGSTQTWVNVAVNAVSPSCFDATRQQVKEVAPMEEAPTTISTSVSVFSS